MKRKLALAALALSVTCAVVQAQPDSQKKELASRIVTLQQGTDLDQLAMQLTGNAIAPSLQKWGPRLQAEIPEARRKEVADRLNAELNKYREDTYAIIKATAAKASTDTLVPAYMERFSEDELRQLATFFDSPVIKKYQAALPELLNALIQKMVERSRPEVEARAAAFDEAAAKIIGTDSGKKSAPKKK